MRRAALLLGVLAAACTSARPPESDWERKNRDLIGRTDEAVSLPAYPRKQDLVEFYVGPTTDFKFFVDASSLSVAPRQREIRYVLVARSPSGVENVSYEVIRCPDEHRVLAVGQNGRWGGQAGDWRQITKGTALGWTYALSRNYFCPHRDSIQTAAEGADALRNGAHPAVEVQRSMGGDGAL